MLYALCETEDVTQNYMYSIAYITCRSRHTLYARYWLLWFYIVGQKNVRVFIWLQLWINLIDFLKTFISFKSWISAAPRDVKGEAVGRAKMWAARRSGCQCNQISDVVWCIPVSSTIHKTTVYLETWPFYYAQRLDLFTWCVKPALSRFSNALEIYAISFILNVDVTYTNRFIAEIVKIRLEW